MMGFFNKLFGKGESASMDRQPEIKTTCLHTSLTGRWDSVEDMGNENKVTGWTCQSCGQTFTPAEGRALRRSEADRVKNELEV
jgi:hypothetical protein